MKSTTSILMAVITAALTGSVMAENNVPPSGPYRSINESDANSLSQYSRAVQQPAQDRSRPSMQTDSQPDQLNSNRQNSYLADIPEWVKQRRMEMEKIIAQQNNRQQFERPNLPLSRPDAPEWVKQQQAQMEQRMQRPNRPPPGWNNQPPPQWNRNQPPAPPMTGHGPVGRPEPQANRMQQYFPSSRGPVYGPGAPPAGFNNQPGYQRPPNWKPRPPAWR